jgi:hypothetical protein
VSAIVVSIDNAERAVQRALAKERQAGAEEERTAGLAAAALAEFHEHGTPATRERRRASDEDAERARALGAKAREATAEAVSKRDAVARQLEVELLGRQEVDVPKAWASALADFAEQARTLDRAADALMLAIARASIEHAAAWSEARDRAASLERPWSHAEPTFDDAILAVQRAASAAREEEGRENVAALFDAEPGRHDWRIDEELTAAQRAQLFAERENAQRRGAELAGVVIVGAAYQAGAQSTKQPPAPPALARRAPAIVPAAQPPGSLGGTLGHVALGAGSQRGADQR